MDSTNISHRADLGLPPFALAARPIATKPERITWTADRVARLRELHKEGFSCSQMAAAIGGVSRNAVIGKLHRLGVVTPLDREAANARRDIERRRRSRLAKEAHAKRMARAAIERQRRGSVPHSMLQQEPLPLSEPAPDSKRLTFADLNFKVCGWIDGDPRAMHSYCGHDVLHGSRYCEHHHAVSHQPLKPRVSKIDTPFLPYRVGSTR